MKTELIAIADDRRTLIPGDKIRDRIGRLYEFRSVVNEKELHVHYKAGDGIATTTHHKSVNDFDGVKIVKVDATDIPPNTIADTPPKRRALEPTWTGVLPLLLYTMENRGDEGREMAREELKRMAEAADAYNALLKQQDGANG